MTYHTYDEVGTAWVKRMLGNDSVVVPRNNRMPVSVGGDALFSYGSHFPLVEAVGRRSIKGSPLRKTKPKMFLLNGDMVSPTTSRHQAVVRGVVSKQDKVPHTIIPFSVLAEAGINRKSIRLIDSTPEFWDEQVTERDEEPEGARWEYEYTRLEGTDYGYIVGPDERYFAQDEWYALSNRERSAYFDAPSSPRWVQPLSKNTGRRTLRTGRGHLWDLFDNGDGVIRYRHTKRTHRLGEALIKAQVETYRWHPEKGRVLRRRTAYFLSGWDWQEERSYFFCELPPGVKPTTVAEAYECLKPQAVVYAESIGREVKRQGDIFAIPMRLTTRDILGPGVKIKDKVMRGAGLIGTNHVATEVIMVNGETFARGFLRHRPPGRRPDHRQVQIGDEWHLIKKNTVPIG